MKLKKYKITNAVISVTSKCNSKCIMCNIWQMESNDALLPDDFLKLPNTLEDVNITGGEPFLRKDIVEIAANISKVAPGAKLIFSSNGFLTEKITKDMIEIKKINPKLSISLSLDGLDDMHSRIRGIDGAFDKVINTVKSLKENNIHDIRFAFTASKENISHLSKVYDLSQNLGIELTLCVVHNADNYYNIQTNELPNFEDLEKELKYVIKNELKGYNLRRLLRTYYIKGILEYVKTNKRPLKCYALDNSFFMDSKGDIYPCNILEMKLGNIKEDNFATMWKSDKVSKFKCVCESCDKCWTVCNVKNAILKHPMMPISKVVVEKIKSLI